MKLRPIHGKLLISISLLAIIILLITVPVKSQEPDFNGLPLDPTSSFILPKPPGATNHSPSDATQSETTSSRIIGVPLPDSEVLVEKTCAPLTVSIGTDIACTITITNEDAEELDYRILDFVPLNFNLIKDSVEGADVIHKRLITHRGDLAAAIPPDFAFGPSLAPDGYRSLAAEGIPPLTNVSDETLINFTTPAYFYDGAWYTDVAMTSNGYLIAGVGSDEELSPFPQNFPDPIIPNNVLAPFWTDLDPAEGGNLYAALLSLSSGDAWIVFEWENVLEFSGDREPNCGGGICDPNAYTFQVWIKINTAVQEISYVYARVDGVGASTGVNVGAENLDGTLGINYDDSLQAEQMASVNNFVVVPGAGEAFSIESIPGQPGGSHTISYQATAVLPGPWYSCAFMKVHDPRSMTWACSHGEVIE